MTYTRKVATNTIVQVIGRIILTAISLTTIGILTRYLGVAGFGQLQTAFSYLAIVTVAADLGFFFILVRDLSTKETLAEKKRFVGSVLTIRILAAAAVYIVAGVLGALIYNDPLIVKGIIYLSFAFFALSIQNTLIAVFQSVFRMDKAVIADCIGKATTLAGVYVVVAMGGSLGGVFAAYIAGGVLNTIAAAVMAHRIVPLSLQFDTKAWRRILVESAPLGIAIIFSTLYFKVDSVMLSLMKGSVDVGIYAPPYKILEVILVVPAIFANTILPIYARYHRDRDPRLGSSVQKTFDALALMGIPIAIGLIATAPLVTRFIAGDEFINASTVMLAGGPATTVTTLKILALSAGLAYLSPAFSYLLTAGGLQRKLILPNIMFLVFNVAVNAVLIPYWSYVAASWVTVATEILVVTTMAIMARKAFGATVTLGKFFRFLVAGILMYCAIVIVGDGLIESIVVGIVVYVVGIVALKAVSLNDLKLMVGRTV